MAVNFVQRRFISQGLKKWAYNLSGFNKYGLMRDDIRYEDEDVTEALNRLPAHLKQQRDYRQLRAMQLSLEKHILPKEQWTKFEDDVMYLKPYIDQVIKEREEREAWNSKY